MAAPRHASSWAGRLLRGAKDYVAAVRDPHPPTSRLLYAFDTDADLAAWTVTSDAAHGGGSSAALARVADGGGGGGAVFSGRLAAAPSGSALRGAYASMMAQQPAHTTLDLSPFDALTLRVSSDGRPYVVSLRTSNWIAGDGAADVWSAFLFAPPSPPPPLPPAFHDVVLPLSRFVLTHRGRLVEARVEMNAGRIVSVGVGAAAPSGAGRAAAATRGGEFRLGVQWIRATASERGLREEGQE